MVNVRKSPANGGKTTVESRNAVFIETPPNLFPATTRLSPQQNLESPSYDFSGDTLDNNYVSHDDMLRDVQNYTSALNFGVDTSVGTVELLLPQQASPGITSPGGASPAGISPGGSYTGGIITSPAPAQVPAPAPAPSPEPAPTLASVAQSATKGTARYARSSPFYPATRAEDFENEAKMD